MKLHSIGLLSAVVFGAGLGSAGVIAQGSQATAAAHVAAAKAAAGQEHTFLFNQLCLPTAAPAPQPGQTAAPQAPGPPDRAQWHAEPVKVFDNLYFVGMTEYSAWAVTTSAGIIIIDAIFDYSVEDEIVGGLKKLGLDPAQIKYVIVSHGHTDHVGGAKYLQDHFGARVILSQADWEPLDRSGGTKPKRDMVATDGQKLTLGDTTLTFYLTPGHTLGTISTLIPVKDGGTPHLVAEWGGTNFNWRQNRAAYITPTRPDKFWYESYSKSAQRFRDIVAKAGADALISNHLNYDGSKTKLPALTKRRPGDRHPYVIGNEAVQRYLRVADECAQAGQLRLN
ncbi:MAG TPA: MBL fold metallo-hydrolase [Chloroflexota bacterium]